MLYHLKCHKNILLKKAYISLLPRHYIIFFSSSFIQTTAPDLKSFSLIKGYCPSIFLIYVQTQFAAFILCIIQQHFTYTLRLHFIRNKNAFNIFAVQPYKALYFPIILIDIDSCL